MTQHGALCSKDGRKCSHCKEIYVGIWDSAKQEVQYLTDEDESEIEPLGRSVLAAEDFYSRSQS